MELGKRKCKPCEGGVPRLSEEEITAYNSMLNSSWKVIDSIKINKKFKFARYQDMINFTLKVAELSEEEGHHPVMHLYFDHMIIEIWTHAILGLSENDFILAAKIDYMAKK